MALNSLLPHNIYCHSSYSRDPGYLRFDSSTEFLADKGNIGTLCTSKQVHIYIHSACITLSVLWRSSHCLKTITISIYTYYCDISHRGVSTMANLSLGLELISLGFRYSQFREGILQRVIQIRILTCASSSNCPPKSIILWLIDIFSQFSCKQTPTSHTQTA